MSLWGTLPFENDDAVDWLDDFLEHGSLEFILEALSAVEEPFAYIEVDAGAVAVAASEVLSQIVDEVQANSVLDLSSRQRLLAEFALLQKRHQEELFDRAINALVVVEALNGHSEMSDLLHSNGKMWATWSIHLRKLRERLNMAKMRL